MAQRKFKIDGGFSTDDASELLANLTMGGTIDMDSNKILNVTTPTADGDAANKVYVDNSVQGVIDAAPGALDTLNELAAAMGDDANFSTTITNSIATKANTTYVDALETTLQGEFADADTAQTTALQTYADTAESDAISTAAGDATTKADTAQSNAQSFATAADNVVISNLQTYADTAETDAIASASADATSKADTARTGAVADVKASDLDMGTNKILYSNVYATTGDFPSAASYHGMFAHAHGTGNAFFAHAGSWVELSKKADSESYADTAEADAISTASGDATSKANTAQTNAQGYTDTAIANLVDSAPGTLDTLNELAAALGDDANYASSVTSAIATAKQEAKDYADANDANTTYSVGDGGLTEHNFTTADHNKLNGIAASATNVTNNNQLTNGAGYITSYTDTNTTYTAGNGMSLSGTEFLMSGSYTGSFTATGDITAYSDDSLKTNVQVIDGALGKVEAIRGVTFERIEDGSVSTGVIAQELKAVLPEAVHTDAEGIHSVAYGNITGLLIEAVKELSAQVAELKAK